LVKANDHDRMVFSFKTLCDTSNEHLLVSLTVNTKTNFHIMEVRMRKRVNPIRITQFEGHGPSWKSRCVYLILSIWAEWAPFLGGLQLEMTRHESPKVIIWTHRSDGRRKNSLMGPFWPISIGSTTASLTAQ